VKYLAYAISFCAMLVFLFFGFKMLCDYDRMMEKRQEEARMEALELAKQGWAYRCGWDCRWERVESKEKR
jgi:hypothetical protein